MNLDTLLHWGEFAAVSAAMEHNGVPINMEIANLLLDKEAWDSSVTQSSPNQCAIRRLCAGQTRGVELQHPTV